MSLRDTDRRSGPQARVARLGRGLRAAAALLALVVAGCASLPASVQRPVTHAVGDVAQTALAGIAAASLATASAGAGSGGTAEAGAAPSADSGLRLLPSGEQAFDARIALARAAQKTIDAQYYLIASDTSGLQFLRELRDAAARGVRVRLLVDDLYAAGQDDLFAGLAAHPNVEVRLFNPLPVREGSFASRIVFSLHDFARINRRMHNKLFVADNSFAIAGGRNIADEYFGRAEPANFIDMDVLVSGAAVREMSAAFDAYWNCDHVYPIQSLAGALPAQARADFEARVAPVAPVAPTLAPDSLGQPGIGAQLAAGRVVLHAGAVRVLADAPSKVDARDDTDGDVMQAHLALIRSARSEVLIASPYFVPGERGVAAIREAIHNDVQLSVMTNSLATTDEPLVHYGYSRYRMALLKMGAALYELMPGAGERRAADDDAKGGFGGYGGSGASVPHGSLGRLHAKLAVVDRRWLFIGSMNMDRRSAHCNQEAALVIDSAPIAAQAASIVRREQAASSYRVNVDAGGAALSWTGRGVTLRSEAESGAVSTLTRVKLQLLSGIVDEAML